MDLRNESSGPGAGTGITLLIATLCLAAFACGTSTSPPPRDPGLPPGGNGSGQPSDPEPQEDSRRPIDPDVLVEHGNAPDTPSLNLECSGREPAIAICSYGGNSRSEPVLLSTTSRVALGEWVVAGGCNFPQGEQVTVSFSPPSGRGMETTVVASALDRWNAGWWITPDKPTGSYSVETRSASGTFAESFQVVDSSEPLLTTGFIPGRSEAAFAVAGFQPDEEILIAQYEVDPSSSSTTLVDHTFLNLTGDGRAIGLMPASSAIVVAIGQETPEVYTGMQVSAYDYFSPDRISSGSRFVCNVRAGSFGGPALPTIDPGSDQAAPIN